jgi:hypothetical protein
MSLMLINTEKIDVDCQSKQDGNTPLHAAAVKGHGLIVALLLIRGARVRIQNKSKATPRHASERGGSESVETLFHFIFDLFLVFYFYYFTFCVYVSLVSSLLFVLPVLTVQRRGQG